VLFRRVRKISNIDYSIHHVCPSACSNSAHTGQIFMKFDIWILLENLSKNIKVSLKYDKNDGYFPSRQCTYMISGSVFLRVSNVSRKVVKKIINTYFIFNFFLRKSCCFNVNKTPTRCNSVQLFIYCKATLHVSGVTAPIIRNTKNCNRSLRYRS